jgi:hypothetical protein
MSGKQLAIERVEAKLQLGEGNTHRPMEFADCLECWKDIATYLRRDVRTVQRWEKTAGLPIHRVQNSKSGSVYAFKSEIDSWRRIRAVKIGRERLPVVQVFSKAEEPIPVKALPPAHRWWIIPLMVGFLAGAAADKIASHFHPIASANPKAVSISPRYPAPPAALTLPKNSG